MKKLKFACLPLLMLMLITATIPPATASNILAIFQHFGYSHFKVYLPVLLELANRGHNLTVVSYIKNPSPHANYKELLLTCKTPINVVAFDDIVVSRRLDILLGEYFALHAEGQRSCQKFYESSYVEHILAEHSKHPYDLVITEYFNTDCHLGIPYLLDVPVVAFSSCALMPWLYERIALPDTPAYVQTEFIGFPERLNIAQRLLNFIQLKTIKLLYRYHTNRLDNQLIKQYLYVDVDIYKEAKRLTGVIFVNQHYTLSGNRPLTPQLVEIGGVHINEQRTNDTLPKAIDDFLSKVPANKDVLLVSFGSMLRAATFDKTKLHAMLTAFQQRDLFVIWKWESDEVPLKHERILFTKWLTQHSLLCHPKIKYFWGHGGMLGTTEAIHCGKPLILTPIYGDQFLNAHAVQNRKIGLLLDYHQIDAPTVENVLNEIQRPRYATNAQALSKIFLDRDLKPLDKAVWTIEHLLKHKKLATELLQTKAVHLNFFVYYSLDSLLIIALAMLAIVLLSLRLFKWMRAKLRRYTKVDAKKKQR